MPDQRAFDRLVASVEARVATTIGRRAAAPMSRPLSRRGALATILAAAAALVLLVGVVGPNLEPPIHPGGSTATDSPVSTSTGEPVQVLTVAELGGLVSEEHVEDVVGRVVLADVDLEPASAQMTCLPYDCALALVAGADPMIRVIDDPNFRGLRNTIPDDGLEGPIAVRIRHSGTVELIGQLKTNLGDQVVWPLRSYSTEAARQLYRFLGSPFGAPYVVDALLVDGQPFPCPSQPAIREELTGFLCGRAAWLAPVEAGPPRIANGNPIMGLDWVRVPNGSYRRFGLQPGVDGEPPNREPRRAYYLILPVIQVTEIYCFGCQDGGAAMLVDRIDPVVIP
jgi:hypothetical protein